MCYTLPYDKFDCYVGLSSDALSAFSSYTQSLKKHVYCYTSIHWLYLAASGGRAGGLGQNVHTASDRTDCLFWETSVETGDQSLEKLEAIGAHALVTCSGHTYPGH